MLGEFELSIYKRDIRRLRDVLRIIEERYHLLADNITEGIWTADLDLNPTYISPSVERVIGRSIEEDLETTLSRVLHAPLHSMSIRTLKEEASGENPERADPSPSLTITFENVRECGPSNWVQDNVSLLRNSKGETTGILGILRDVTQQRELEKKLVHHEDFLRSIVDVVSHELRHPIAVIKGFSRTILDNRGDLEKESVSEALEGIDNASDRLAFAVTKVLDTWRIDRGKLKMAYADVRPIDLITSAIAQLASCGCATGITFKQSNDERTVTADPEMITNVLVILLENAVKYSPDSSKIETWHEWNTKEVVFSVADNGPGIPPDAQEKIFERFYQVDKALNHSLPGMGLGLYIAKKIVDAHDGWINVEPRAVGGSIFKFGIPESCT